MWNRLTGKSNTWTGKFTNLPKYDSTDGHEIVYTVKEEPVPDHYVATVDDATRTVTNTRNGNLLVEKVVTGTDGETNRAFHFTVELSDKSVSGVHGGVTFTNGVAAFTLKSGDKVLIEDLPAGCTYTVTEAEANADGYTTVSQGAAGKIEAGQTATAQIENHRDAVPRPTPSPTPDPEEETTGTPGGTVLPQTSDDANLTALYVLLGLSAVGLAALAGYGIYRRKKGR
ncbi:Cna B-type domain-containing protein [uncultured Subdoligranulum sp.]|uniref:Cna B-type domain-containing protein n=1 Tax=uncultured Subdoligranulum sp. TaxID=512298 RepID=UPI00262A04F3|nr:Cna B-type domain-containing protein [uncultured Subdoligranulum sp.]